MSLGFTTHHPFEYPYFRMVATHVYIYIYICFFFSSTDVDGVTHVNYLGSNNCRGGGGTGDGGRGGMSPGQGEARTKHATHLAKDECDGKLSGTRDSLAAFMSCP